jgi:hypothetical protein
MEKGEVQMEYPEIYTRKDDPSLFGLVQQKLRKPIFQARW